MPKGIFFEFTLNCVDIFEVVFIWDNKFLRGEITYFKQGSGLKAGTNPMRLQTEKKSYLKYVVTHRFVHVLK